MIFMGLGGLVNKGVRCQVSAPLLAAEAVSLIEEKLQICGVSFVGSVNGEQSAVSSRQ